MDTREFRPHLSTSPYLKSSSSTREIMFQVVYSLIPVVIASIWFFGLSALLILLTCIVSCLLTEYIFNASKNKWESVRDGSGLITGILLALTLPPGFPLWMAFIGGVVAIGMGKMMWGGMGQNVFNPALLGRAFLQAAFPTAITTWSPPNGSFFSLKGTNHALPFFQAENVEGITGATPLAKMKFEHTSTDMLDLLVGNTSGSLGETCGILILLGGLYLIIRNIMHWRIPLAVFLTVTLFSLATYLMFPGEYPTPWFMLFSGGMMLGTLYMATDLVTSPLTPKGCWIYGAGIGILVVLIRLWGGLPEGMMYAILLMNSATPLINRYSSIRTYGY